MPEICKMLTLSISHMTRETQRIIDTEAETNTLGLCVYEKGEFGWYVYVDECARRSINQTAFQEYPDLLNCIDRATKLGCDIICFDADGSVDELLPVYP